MSPRALSSDAELMRRARGGDDLAFGEVALRHRSLLMHVVVPIVGPHMADDVIQQALISAWVGRARFDPEAGSAANWLAAIARNRSIDALRAGRRHLRVAPLGEESDAVAASEPGPEELAQRGALASELREAIAQLTPTQREAIEQCYFDELTHREIHERTRAPLGTVKSRVRLGLVALASILDTAAATSR